MTTSIKTSPISDQLGSIVSPGNGNKVLDMSSADQIVDLFKNRGLLLFRGFDLSQEGFIKFTEQLTPNFMDYSGGAYARESIGGDETVLSVTGNRQFFGVPFHGEMFYTQNRPSILWFYCVVPPVSDGETTVCDGVAVLEQLSANTRRLFEEQEIKYIRHYSSKDWQGIYATDDVATVAKTCAERNTKFTHFPEDNSISTEYQCSAVTTPLYLDKPAFVNNILPVILQETKGNTHSLVRFSDDSKIPEEAIDDIQAVTDRLTLAVAWQAKDLVMVDNSRSMHGRHEFNDTQRELNVRMSSNLF